VTTTTPSTLPLEGTPWTLDNVSLPTTSPVVITAEFSGGQLAGSGGCNRYTAPYQTDASKLTFQGQAATTMMACPPPISEAETAYLAKLGEVRSFRIVGDRLELADEEGATILSFVATQTSLVGTWAVTSLRTPDAVTGPAQPITVTFSAQGEVSGNSGCNDFGGSYTSEGTAVSITGLAATTTNSCTPQLTQQEQNLFAALTGAAQVEAGATSVTLKMADGTIAATLAEA